jgi:endonuclease/exonuclease/phosphatase family metal-dependent hydrolase
MKVIRISVLIANIIAALLLLLCYFSPYFDPEYYWPFGILGLIFPFLIMLNLLFVLFWIFFRLKYSLISLIIILVGWNSFRGVIGLNLPEEKQDTSNSFRVMSYNIRALSKLKTYPTKNFKENQEKLNFYLRENTVADVLCLQETTKPNVTFFENELGYDYFIRYPGYNSRTCILSKFPIIHDGTISFDHGYGDAVWADIEIVDTIIRFYSVHLHSNTISLDADNLLSQSEIQTQQALKGARGMFTKYRFATRIRYEQAKKLKKHIDSSPYPVVLCGDFNDTPQSYVYHVLNQNLKDTFKERGIGFGTTWAGSLPGLKIDYILCSNSFLTINHQILRRPFSDHYPIISTLKFE